MKKLNIISNPPHNTFSFEQESGTLRGNLTLSGINHYNLEAINTISGVRESQLPLITFDFGEKDFYFGNAKHSIRLEKDRINSKISFLQTAEEKALKMQFGTVLVPPFGNGAPFVDSFNLTYKTGNLDLDVKPRVNGVPVLLSGEVSSLPSTILYTTGNQVISGTKYFVGSLGVGNSSNPNNNKLYLYNSGTSNFGIIQFLGGSIPDPGQQIYFKMDDNYLGRNMFFGLSESTISGNDVSKENAPITFPGGINVSGTGVFNAIDSQNVDALNLSGIDVTITDGKLTINEDVVISGRNQYNYIPADITTTSGNVTAFSFNLKKDNIYRCEQFFRFSVNGGNSFSDVSKTPTSSIWADGYRMGFNNNTGFLPLNAIMVAGIDVGAGGFWGTLTGTNTHTRKALLRPLQNASINFTYGSNNGSSTTLNSGSYVLIERIN